MTHRHACAGVALALLTSFSALPAFAQDVPIEPGMPGTGIYGSPYADVSDEEIAKDVRLALRLEPYAGRQGIVVNVNDGVVTLSGVVESAVERYDAERAARQVNGVVAVKNELKVRR